jgi:ADP-heptose:LPS heptosyltransferase
MPASNLPTFITAGSIKNILFISVGGIGNMILLTPAISLLSQAFPDATFHYLLTASGSREIVEKHPQTGSIVEWDHSNTATALIALHLTKLKPDCVFSTAGTNPLKCGIVGLLAGARMRIGEDFGAGHWLYTRACTWYQHMHEKSVNVLITRMLAPKNKTPAPVIHFDPSDHSIAQEFAKTHGLDKPFIGMHLAASISLVQKHWSIQQFIALGKMLKKETSMPIVLFGGSIEKRIAESAAQAIGDNVISVAGSLSIRQSALLLKNCPAFISADTGPMHLAAVSGCSVVALFGPTDPLLSGPVGKNHIIIANPCTKGPCYHAGTYSCNNRTCMHGISVEQVFSAVITIIAHAG